jgi:hypothetical protein
VAKDGKAFHAVDACQPGAQLFTGRIVNCAIASKGGNGGWIQTAQINISHCYAYFYL